MRTDVKTGHVSRVKGVNHVQSTSVMEIMFTGLILVDISRRKKNTVKTGASLDSVKTKPLKSVMILMAAKNIT